MLRAFSCKNNKLEEVDFSTLGKKFCWIDAEDPTQEEVELLKQRFGFHPLALEDATTEQRSKLDDYGNYLFLVASFPTETSARAQLSFFLGQNYLVTIHKGKSRIVESIVERYKKNPKLLQHGFDFLVYQQLDTLSDELSPLLEKLEDQVDEIEDKVIKNPDPQTLAQMFELRKNLFEIRKLLWPLRDLLSSLSKQESKFLKRRTMLHLRDVHESLIRATEFLDTLRERMTLAAESYFSSVSTGLNLVMKKLTSIMAILMIPTLIAGVYGMNFSFMPELQWKYGYFFTLGLMIGVALLLLLYFRRKRWL